MLRARRWPGQRIRAHHCTPGRPTPSQDMRAALAGQSEGVAPSIVMAEEEAHEVLVTLVAIQAVAPIGVAGEAPAHVEPENSQWTERQPKAKPVAADHVPVD